MQWHKWNMLQRCLALNWLNFVKCSCYLFRDSFMSMHIFIICFDTSIIWRTVWHATLGWLTSVELFSFKADQTFTAGEHNLCLLGTQKMKKKKSIICSVLSVHYVLLYLCTIHWDVNSENVHYSYDHRYISVMCDWFYVHLLNLFFHFLPFGHYRLWNLGSCQFFFNVPQKASDFDASGDDELNYCC